MAGFQPSEDEIQSFMAFVPMCTDRREAIARIKGNNNNVEYAINEYFDTKASQDKYQWVDGQFSSGRDGEFMPNSTPGFNIHALDETGPYEVREPQTRPPSRSTNNRTPNPPVIDLTMQHANADPHTSVTHDDDAELQRALAESMVSAGLPPQETGITSTDKVAFGPANRPQYEEKDWGMITVGKSSTQEILLEPEPAGRKRDINVPAFLKPSVENHRLGALLTIYHEIPLLREIFLNRLDVLQNYGFDPEWWSGSAIQLPVVLGLEPDEGQELIYEIQRLMAFLDKTDRSYGSVEALTDLHSVKRMQRIGLQRGVTDLETVFFQVWKRAFDNRETGHISKLFSIGVDSEQRTDAEEFAILDLPLPVKGSGLETFYDIADDSLWPQTETDITNCAYLEHIADIVTFHLSEKLGPSDGVDIPAVWYADRYMKSGRQAALDMRIQKNEVIEELRQIMRVQESLTDVCARGKILKVKKLLNAALQHEVDQVKDEDEIDASVEDNFISEGEATARFSSEKAAKLSTDLGKLVASIDKKLLDLNSQKEKARETLRELSKLYTEASSDPTEPPTHKYTLRGVSTTKSTMYIRRKAEIDLIDMGLEYDGVSSDGDQWWRIEYRSSGSNPVIVEKTTEENVLEAAKTEGKDIILVYASEKAMQFVAKPLPHPLETFVRNDNQVFQEELVRAEDSQSQEDQSHFTSPGKRKFQSHSDSEESNRFGGTSPKGYETSLPEKVPEYVQIRERELTRSSDDSEMEAARIASQHLVDQLDESRTVTPGVDEPDHEIIHGVDPNLLGNDDSPFSGQEMQERSGIPMLSGRGGASTIDSMDLDQVMEDEHTAGESAAVRSVELE